MAKEIKKMMKTSKPLKKRPASEQKMMKTSKPLEKRPTNTTSATRQRALARTGLNKKIYK
jgi:hypothetical protein